MVLRHFKLREQPFGVTPDPRYLYASATHREALSSILYGIESGLGFVTITAKPGMGKTTLLFEALHRLKDTTKTVFLFQTISSPLDLLQALLMDLGVKDLSGSFIEMQSKLNEVLVAQSETGKRLVVAIDEAQNLDESTLETVRMLSNFETSRHKLMQIVLSGQLQLAEKLELPQLLQLRQRISIFGHLKPLSSQETSAYIQHRLRVAGLYSDEPIFSPDAVSLIARYSEGIPRNINNICFNALSLGAATQAKIIDTAAIEEVAQDLRLEPLASNEKLGIPALRRNSREVPEQVEEDSSLAQKQSSRTPLRTFSFVAAVCVALGVIGWLATVDYRAMRDKSPNVAAAEQEKASVPPAVEANRSVSSVPIRATAPASEQSSTPANQSLEVSGTRFVKVKTGQSLHGICEEIFRRCSPEVFREMVRMNPSISNPDHIVAGQRVAVPTLPHRVPSDK